MSVDVFFACLPVLGALILSGSMLYAAKLNVVKGGLQTVLVAPLAGLVGGVAGIMSVYMAVILFDIIVLHDTSKLWMLRP